MDSPGHSKDLTPCPFCNTTFKRVGNHLPHCKKRDGRNYSQFLAPKTLKKKLQSVKKTKCLKCNRLFVRLDTHLRKSAMCKDIPSLPSSINTTATDVCMTPPEPCQDLACVEDSMFLSPQDSNPVVATSAALIRFTQTTNTDLTLHFDPKVKKHLNLPKTSEGWEKANLHFNTTLVPAVMAAPTPQEKNSLLVEGVYEYFALACGTRHIAVQKRKKRPLHNRSLKEVGRKKREAKRELRLAQQRGFPSDVIKSLARHFFSLVRCHSSLKRSSNAQLLARNAKDMRQQCYKNLGRCAKEVLDGSSAQITPAFSEANAYKYFTEVYHSGPRNYVQPEWMPTPSLPDMEMDCSPFTAGRFCRSSRE